MNMTTHEELLTKEPRKQKAYTSPISESIIVSVESPLLTGSNENLGGDPL